MYRRIGIIVAAAAMGMLVAGTPAQAAAAPALGWSPTTSAGTYDFGTVDGVGHQSATQMFTLTNSGRSSTGTLAGVALTNSSGTAFSIISDGCTGLSLGPNRSCQVTVHYAPTTNGEIDSATLTATGEHAAASITLTGHGGTADLTLSPGTLTGTDGNGTNAYNYDFGLVGSGITDTYTFTVTNSGTGTSNTLQIPPCCTTGTGFTLSNDHVSGSPLAPGGTATFDLTFSATCTAPTTFSTPLVVNAQNNGSPYISVNYTATCGPPITSVTATLGNLALNPQFITIGNPGSQQPMAVFGTLKNVSVGPTQPPPPLKCPPNCEGLHSFTMQIPFSTDAGTLYCSMGNATNPGTCSVSNNVLTVTQNFIGIQPFRWLPGHSEGPSYYYVWVGASQLNEHVTWGPPTITAAN